MGQARITDVIPHSQHLLLETIYSRQHFQNFTMKTENRNNPSKKKTVLAKVN